MIHRRRPAIACKQGGKAQPVQRCRDVSCSGRQKKVCAVLQDFDQNTPGGTLELFVEPNDAKVVHNADNITVAPNGELFVCEDHGEGSRLLRVTPDGKVATFAKNRLSGSELAGVCFTPDNSTMFVNIQHDHLTLAIRGPFAK